MTEGPVLLFDGTCAFCAESVRFVLRHERRHTLRFAALDGGFGRAFMVSHPELARADSLVWFERGASGAADVVLTHSSAAVCVARYLGGPWHMARLLMVLPRGIRDGGYRLIAAHRHRLLPGDAACFVPTPEIAERFLS